LWLFFRRAAGVSRRLRRGRRSPGKIVTVGKPADVVGQAKAPGFEAAVIGVDCLSPVVDRGGRIVEKENGVVAHRKAIALEAENIVSALVEDGLGGLALAMHGVRGDGPAFEIKQVEQSA
jgi:hypothetical protein